MTLPVELLIQIFNRLETPEDIHTCSKVCKFWRVVVVENDAACCRPVLTSRYQDDAVSLYNHAEALGPYMNRLLEHSFMKKVDLSKAWKRRKPALLRRKWHKFHLDSVPNEFGNVVATIGPLPDEVAAGYYTAYSNSYMTFTVRSDPDSQERTLITGHDHVTDQPFTSTLFFQYKHSQWYPARRYVIAANQSTGQLSIWAMPSMRTVRTREHPDWRLNFPEQVNWPYSAQVAANDAFLFCTSGCIMYACTIAQAVSTRSVDWYKLDSFSQIGSTPPGSSAYPKLTATNRYVCFANVGLKAAWFYCYDLFTFTGRAFECKHDNTNRKWCVGSSGQVAARFLSPPL